MSLVAQTIFEQLGGRRMAMMTGSKQFLYSDNILSFKIGSGAKNAIKTIRIELEPSDTYKMVFFGSKGNVKALYDGVYCDMLTDIFTQETGFYTKF
jgi:hypothetical protein